MATPIHDAEYEAQKQKGKELIAAGGCHAIRYWSKTDAERLCPPAHNILTDNEPPFYTSDWVKVANKAIELIQSGIKLLSPSLQGHLEAVEKESFLIILDVNMQAQIAGYYNDDKTDAERAIRNAVIEEYKDLIDIYKHKFPQGASVAGESGNNLTKLRNELAEKEGSAYHETSAARTVAFKNGWDACLENIGKLNNTIK